MAKVRILSLNTWKNDGDYDRRLPLIALELSRLKPDIALLQECFVCQETGDDTTAYLAGEIGMDFVFDPSRQKLRTHRGSEMMSESGLAILYRGSLLDKNVLLLPSSDMGGERIALRASLEIQGLRTCVVCSHFSHIRGEVSIRSRQIDLSFAEALGDSKSDISVLGGDFNCEPNSEEVELALSNHVPFNNALSFVGCSDATCPLPPSRTRRNRQIDQVWVSDSGDGRPKIVDAGVAMNQPVGDSPLFPSDHAAVWVDLELT